MPKFNKSHFKQVFMHWYQRANPDFDENQDPAFKISGDTATLPLSSDDLYDISPALGTLYAKATITIKLKVVGESVKVDFKFVGVPTADMQLDRDVGGFDEPLNESSAVAMTTYVKAL